MRRLLPAVLVALAAAGCGRSAEPVQPSVGAPPQAAELGWVERFPAQGEHVVFRVRRFEVTEDGWRADVSVSNRTSTGFSLGDPAVSHDREWGLLLFRTGELEEVEERGRAGRLPGTRHARSYRPPLTVFLEPGATWSGALSARGALASGRFVRVVFGPLVPLESREGIPDRLVWITDSAYELRGP